MGYILAAILSSISYALAENLTGVASKKNNPITISFWTVLIGFILLTIPAFTIFSHEFQNLNTPNLLIIILVSLLLHIANLLFFTGLKKGPVTLVGVIGGGFPAITAIIAIFIFKETLNLSQFLAILLIVIGVATSSTCDKLHCLIRNIKKSGAVYALGAFLFWGLYFALVRIPVQQVGWFMPQYISTIIGIILFFLITKIKHKEKLISKPNLFGLVILVEVLQISGGMLYNYAIKEGPTSIVAPIAGSYPVLFVLLALAIFKERLNKKQWLGIALALAGIIILSKF